MNKKLDFFFDPINQWHEEFIALRAIIPECGLDEALKWSQAWCTKDGKNSILIHGFFKGALLPGPKKILVQQNANVQAARQIRFTDIK